MTFLNVTVESEKRDGVSKLLRDARPDLRCWNSPLWRAEREVRYVGRGKAMES